MAKRRPMTGWYNPAILAQTGIRVAVSTVFGQFFDKREAMAAANAISPQPFDGSFDYWKKGGKDGLWLDFAADSGDGWDSTFAVARLLAAPSLTVGGETIPRGDVLVMGGDQVYPSASRKEYGERLLGPLEKATRIENERSGWPRVRPDLYVIPGNHDWYDGLNSFFGLFCRRSIARRGTIGQSNPGRPIAGWQTQQTRSYFAIRLSEKWWLWGTDAQLGGYIDQPQLDYFRHVASKWMEEESKVILCVGEPAWTYVQGKRPDARFNRFAYLEELVARAGRGHRVGLVLTGDSHHYARFRSGGVDYVTCGGGGAFLHPTHQLKSREIAVESWGPDGASVLGEPRRFDIARTEQGSEALYPSRATSRALSWANLAFAALNPWFTLMVFLLYLTFNWMLNVNAHILSEVGLVDLIQNRPDQAGGGGELAQSAGAGAKGGEKLALKGALASYWRLMTVSPWTVLLMCGAIGAYYYFADSPRSRRLRFAIGLAHWAVQTLCAVAVTRAVLDWDQWAQLPGAVKSIGPGFEAYGDQAIAVIPIVAATAVAAIVAATLLGAYLIIMLNLFGKHANEAFSSLRIAGFKSFLRLRIDGDEHLTVHAIGLEEAPRTRRKGDPSTPEPQPHLIERFQVR